MKHLLLPIDGSARSLRTIETVQQLFSPLEADVTILMVLPGRQDDSFESQKQARKAQDQLDTFAALLPAYQVYTTLRWGSPGPEIVTYAQLGGFDTVVMTRSSRGPLRKLGSVAAYVVRNAPTLDLFIKKEAGKKDLPD
jgi:nucleotide-binding universal stress UspA family protein